MLKRDISSTIEIAIRHTDIKLKRINIGKGHKGNDATNHPDKLMISTKCVTYRPNETFPRWAI
mgnify:CR=1 FL=1